MRVIIVFATLFILASDAFGQAFVFPETTNVYSDSFAIHVRRYVAEDHYKQELEISTAFEDYKFRIRVEDSVIVVPYYTLYDKERMLGARLATTSRFARSFNESIRLKPFPKSDSIEAKIYRVAENPGEKNLINLAMAYEEVDCYGNALYIYWKLSRLGNATHLKNFLIRNKNRCTRPPSVHR